MGDPLLSLDQMSELVETVFESVGEEYIEGTGPKAKLRYANAAGDFVQVDLPSFNVSSSGCTASGSCAVFYLVFPSELIDPLSASRAMQALVGMRPTL